MIDVEELLRSDAQRWNAQLRPVLDLDEQLAAQPRARSTRRSWLPLLAAVLVGGVCVTGYLVWPRSHSSQPAVDPRLQSIVGVTWRDPASGATVVYTATTMRVEDGCNNTLHRLRLHSGSLAQGRLIGVAIGCGGGPGSPRYERLLSHFYDVVRGPARWARTGDVLTLSVPGNGVIHLVTTGRPAVTLVGPAWRLTTYSGADGQTVSARTGWSLHFSRDGSFSATVRCGSAEGYVESTVSDLRFTVSHVFIGHCRKRLHDSDNAGDAIEAMINAGTVRYTIRGADLIIDYGHDAILAFHSGG